MTHAGSRSPITGSLPTSRGDSRLFMAEVRAMA